MNISKTIDGLKFLRSKLFNGIYGDKASCLSDAIAYLEILIRMRELTEKVDLEKLAHLSLAKDNETNTVNISFTYDKNLSPGELVYLLTRSINSVSIIDESRAAREKQVAKTPDYTEYEHSETEWVCPVCGKRYEVDRENYEYCPNCGQHINHKPEVERL